MRIAYVINSVEGGGAAAPVPSVIGLLQAQGCDVQVLALTARDARGLRAIEQAGLPVIVRQGGDKDHIAALLWLDRQIRTWQPDLIWTSLSRATLLGQIVGQRRRIDVVSWQHAAFLKPVNALLLRMRRRRSILWVADSNNVAAWARQKLKLPAHRVMVWPLFAADENAPQAKPWCPNTPLRIGSLGRLHRVKGYDVLIAALARLRAQGVTARLPIEVDIAGDGDLREELIAQAAAAGLHELSFVGFTEARSFLPSLHLYVQPSRSEGLCIAAHEAMQAGLPVVASAVGELAYSIVDGETGRIVPPADPDALARALQAVLADPLRLAPMGRAARARVLDRFGGAAFARAGQAVLQRIRLLQSEDGAFGQDR